MFLSPEDLPNPEIEPGSPALQADSLVSEPTGKPCGHLNGERNPKKRGDICIHMADSLCCTVGTNTTL